MAEIEDIGQHSAGLPREKTPRQREKLSLEKLRRGSVDRRLKEFREAARIKEAIYEDLGGEDGLSTTQKILIDRIVFKLMAIQALELGALSGEADLITVADRYYLANVNSLRRDLSTIGLKRVRKAVGLSEYIDSKKVEVK